ncbi:MAG: winged helix-turn-helix domain-containing protein [Pseudomonadota bacterium]
MNLGFTGEERALDARSRSVDLAHLPDFALGPLRVQPSLRKIVGNGGEVTLEPKVMQVLVALTDPVETILSRDDLIVRCWDGRIVGDTSINRAISNVRKGLQAALAQDEADAVSLENVPKVGYRIVVAPGFALPSVGVEATTPKAGQTPETPANTDIKAPFPNRIVAIATLALALALGAFAFWQWSSSTPIDPVRIAIAPLEADEGVDPLFVSGLESELRTELGRNQGVIVSTPESARQLADEGIGAAEIGRRLDAELVLTGRVANPDDKVILELAVVKSEGGEESWSGRIATSPEETEMLPHRAARTLLEALGRPTDASTRTSNISQGDFAAYLSAIAMIKSRDPAQIGRAGGLLEEIVERNPDFSQGWSGFAKARFLGAGRTAEEQARAQREASELADKALKLDPDSVEAHKIAGLVSDDSETRHHMLQKAVELDPGDAEAWFWLSHASAHPDYPGGELEAMVQAAKLDPLWNRTWQASTYAASAGKPELADEIDQNIIAAAAQPWQAQIARGRMALRSGELDEYVRLMRDAMGSMDPATKQIMLPHLANILVLLGQAPQPVQIAGMPGVVENVASGILPDKQMLDAAGVKPDNFWRIIPIAISAPSLFIRDGRTEELLDLYDKGLGSPEALRSFAETQIRPHHAIPNTATYVGVALREAGREEEAKALFKLAEESVARWKASGDMDMTATSFEANLAAAQGQRTRAIAAIERLVNDLGWPYAQASPGVALLGPLGRDPVWDGLRGDPELEAALAPVRKTLARNRP